MAYPYRHDKETRVLSEGFGDPAARTVAGWKAMGGYQGIARALEIGRESTIEEVKASGLRECHINMYEPKRRRGMGCWRVGGVKK
ncbi:MAG: hypothetical protein F4X60_11760, partial [Gemmatimonadetes bacterium]|nr:hypothetical protein [Gemmatimonadota bacterium]